MYIQSELLAEEIDEAYEGKLQEVKVIDDTEEETVTDEPIIRGGEVEQTKEPLTEETEELPEQGNEVSVSPVYRQYLDVQKANPQAVVLLRLGDFYEVMGENARTVAEELDLTLTSREVGLASMQGKTAAWRSPMRWTGRTALPVSTLTIAWARTASVRHLQTKYCPNAARRISKVR